MITQIPEKCNRSSALQAHWIIDQLILQGVSRFCIAPGSRSAPLALAAAAHPKATTIVHFDERGLAFLGLGIGKSHQKIAALITTSGTAVANLFPAVMESHHAHIPLILLTADRPHELRDCGANQTTDQVKFFTSMVRWETELSLDLEESSVRSMIAQGVFHATMQTPGPVHFNCPLQEPLYESVPCPSSGTEILFSQSQLVAHPKRVTARRGLILLGDGVDDVTPILQLAKRLQWPLFADLLSNARSKPTEEQIQNVDAIIQSTAFPKPEFVLHLGGRFISKAILSLKVDLHVSPHACLQDPTRSLSERIYSDLPAFCESFQAGSDPDWLSQFKNLDAQIQRLEHPISQLPSDRPIFLGNSMPIRDANHYFFPKKAPLLFANRGVSGIDGNIATMAGLAEGLQTSVVGYIGDQAALHDLNSLPLLRKWKCLLIISNNFGGAIFSKLRAIESPFFDPFFKASHPFHFEGAASMFQIPYVRREQNLKNLPTWGVVEWITA